MKKLVSEVAGGSEDSQQNQPTTKNPIFRTVRLVLSEQQSGSLTPDTDVKSDQPSRESAI